MNIAKIPKLITKYMRVAPISKFGRSKHQHPKYFNLATIWTMMVHRINTNICWKISKATARCECDASKPPRGSQSMPDCCTGISLSKRQYEVHPKQGLCTVRKWIRVRHLIIIPNLHSNASSGGWIIGELSLSRHVGALSNGTRKCFRKYFARPHKQHMNTMLAV